MLATGGGHGNFLWLLLFLYAEFLGLFFPLIGFALPDLRPIWARAVAISLVVANLVISIIVVIWGGVDQDIQKSWQRSPELFVVLALAHFVPLILIATYVFAKASTESEESQTVDEPIAILK